MAMSFEPKVQSDRPESTPNEDLLRESCGRELGNAVAAIDPIVGLGLIKSVYRVSLSDGSQVILRLVKSADPYLNYDKEIWCLKFLQRRKECRVPVPLGRGRIDAFEHMQEEYIEGEPGSFSEANTLHIWKRLAR
jgi:hypothetical protein